MGTTQGSQCPDPTHEVYTPERNFFEKFWKRCIEAHVRNYGPDEPITFVPEYGLVLPSILSAILEACTIFDYQ